MTYKYIPISEKTKKKLKIKAVQAGKSYDEYIAWLMSVETLYTKKHTPKAKEI